MEHRLHNVVMARLDAIANAEKITRAELGHLSREALTYVMDTQDIDFINRLMGVLTPMNKQTCILYFSHFLPWEHENDKDDVFQRFGKKMLGDKKLAKRVALIEAWLADETNNVWTWAKDNVDISKKPDFKARVTSSIKKALEGDEGKEVAPLTSMELLAAIFEGGFDLMSAVEEYNVARVALEAHAQALMDGTAEGTLETEQTVIAA